MGARALAENRSGNQLDCSLVSNFSLFQTLSSADLERVMQHARVRSYAIGEAVFVQGDKADRFFALLHGRLKVTQTTADGQQIVVRHVNPGDVAGIAKALRRPDYPATASAVAESLALEWPSTEWDALVALSPALALNALQTVGQRLDDAHTRIRELSTEEVERRVAHAVLRLVNQGGKKTEDGVLIDFPVTRQDIAEMTGTTLFAVSRLMTAWEKQGLVKSARKKIVVTDPHRLVLLADGTPHP